MKPALLFFLAATAHAQFSSAFLQDEKYWGDGKAEFNIYDAQEVRYGVPRQCEVIHILVREPFAERDLVKAEPDTHGGTYPVIKLNQILHIPTGVYVYQQMHSAFWRCDTGDLVKATLTSNDSCGNTYKELRALGGLRGLMGKGWRYEWRTYWEGMSAGEERITPPFLTKYFSDTEDLHALPQTIFFDELPMRVRTIDFGNAAGDKFGVWIASSIVNSKKDDVRFRPARVVWKREGGDRIQIEIYDKAGYPKVDVEAKSTFQIDARPPHRLLKWARPGGDTGELRRSLKIDYWNYNQPGDKERALNSTQTKFNDSEKEGASLW